MNKDPHTADKVLNNPREMTLDRTHALHLRSAKEVGG